MELKSKVESLKQSIEFSSGCVPGLFWNYMELRTIYVSSKRVSRNFFIVCGSIKL